MILLRRAISGFRGLFHKTEVEQELDDELREYLETAAERKMLAGMSRKEAVRAARVQMGSLEAVKDRARDVGWESLVETSWQDVRYAIRMLRSSPGFATVAIVTLALGIGANSAIFSVLNSLLLRALPVVEPQRLVTISSATYAANPGLRPGWTYATWNQIRERAQTFDGSLAWQLLPFNLAQAGETQQVEGMLASGDFFTTLGVPAFVGRTFTAADDVRGGGPDGPVAVISYRLWQRRFGGATTVIGTPLVVERIPFTIIGVTPPEFFGVEVGRNLDVALPIGAEPLIHGKDTYIDSGSFLTVMLRLKPGQSVDAATAALRAVQPQIREATMPPNMLPRYQQEFLKEPFTLVPAGPSPLRQRYERPFVAILALGAVVLLIACANIANLLLARATARRHELSVRLALGAPRWRLARQLLVESLILAGIGAVVGLVVAAWSSRALVAQLSTWRDRVFLDLSLDWHVIAFTAAVAIATAVLFGTAPAFCATRVALIDVLKEHGRSDHSLGGGGRMSTVERLVVGQVALSMVLVVAAGLFVRTFERLATLPLGFDGDRVLVVNVDATHASIDAADRLPFYQRLVAASAVVPGVAHAGASIITPMGIGSTITPVVDVPGAPTMSEAEHRVLAIFITPGWFAAYGMAILAGRDLEEHDTKTAPPVVLVNAAFVHKFFQGRNAIGGTVAYAPEVFRGAPAPKTVVGVVGDVVSRSLREEVPPTMYLPLAQWDLPFPPADLLSISVRSAAGSPMLLARSVGAALTAVDRDVAFPFGPHLLSDQVNATFTQERIVAMLAGFFGALALLLAGLGLYGVTSYAVTRRRKEIGIRIALGAQRSDVIRLVLGQSIVMTAIGIVFGLGGAAALTRYMEGMLFGLTPLDPTTFIAVSLMFVVVATLAAFVPARRATKVDPLLALRCE